MSVLRENIRYHALLYLISPFLGLIYGIRSKSLVYIRWTIFVFTTIYGSLFTFALFGGERGVDKGADGARHLDNVYKHYQYKDFGVWWDELIAILSFAPKSGSNDDVFIHVVSYIAGTIFNAPGLFFLFVGIVYAYFFSGSLMRIFKYINWKSGYNRFYFLFFLIMFVLWKNPSDMQAVRFWTGMWVLIYAVLSYHDTKKRKYLWLALTPPLVHVGFFAVALPFWLVLFSGFRKPKIYFIVFVFSIFISTAVEQLGLLNYASQTELTESKTRAYYVDDERKELTRGRTEKKVAGSNFYKQYHILRIHFKVLTGIIFIIFFLVRNEGFTDFENTLFSYGLAGASFSNFFVSIFAVHNRGWETAGFFILALLVLFLSKKSFKDVRFAFLKIKFPLFLAIVAFIPMLLYKISAFLNLSSAFIMITPFISWINSDVGISIKDVIVIFL